MNTATFIKNTKGTGDARLYKLSTPLDGNDYVVVSATIALMCGPETYIFGSDENGTITNWDDLEGSFRGGLDHAEALKGAGYDNR